MSAIERAKKFLLEFIFKHPHHEKQARDYFQLMLDEMESGESANNELSIFQDACMDLLED